MKRGITVLVSLSAVMTVAYFTAGKWAIHHEMLTFYDASRGNRPVAVDIAIRRDKELQANVGMITLPVAILNHGNTVKFTQYSFLANVFAARGYIAISIQHDLPNDPPMVTKVGQLYVGRQPQYLRGVANIRFVVEEMKKLQPNADYDNREAEKTLHFWDEAIADRSFLPAAINLANYLALRRLDLGEIQSALTELGLSSLGRSESHVAATLQAVRASLARITGIAGVAYPMVGAWNEGHNLLALRKRELFGALGPAPAVMVTMPSEAARDRDLVQSLLDAGMNCARINCAHDDPEVWQGIITHVRSAASELGRDCRILMDIGGPKCRIESISPKKPKRLHVGDRFRVLRELETAHVGSTPAITISFPEVVARLEVGSLIWINDGKIRGRVIESAVGGWTVEVVGARGKGEKLRLEKGVDMPGVDLGLPPHSTDDLRDLDFVAANADLVGFSFVQRPSDILLLDKHLADRLPGKPLPPLVLKIETAIAVQNLPRLIVQAAGRRPVAIMIARGDLAAALGFGRMAEIQEEMLWLCEAACVPVVWATQVLDDLVRDGLPSRAEATDAAMAQRAECVMLNKGPYLVGAIHFLADIFARMDRHQVKKSARLGPLHSWPSASLKLDP